MRRAWQVCQGVRTLVKIEKYKRNSLSQPFIMNPLYNTYPQVPGSSQYGSGAASFFLGQPTQLTPGTEHFAPIYSLNNVYTQQQAYNMQMQYANKVAIDN